MSLIHNDSDIEVVDSYVSAMHSDCDIEVIDNCLSDTQ